MSHTSHHLLAHLVSKDVNGFQFPLHNLYIEPTYQTKSLTWQSSGTIKIHHQHQQQRICIAMPPPAPVYHIAHLIINSRLDFQKVQRLKYNRLIIDLCILFWKGWIRFPFCRYISATLSWNVTPFRVHLLAIKYPKKSEMVFRCCWPCEL